jgi:hypothetical protein
MLVYCIFWHLGRDNGGVKSSLYSLVMAFSISSVVTAGILTFVSVASDPTPLKPSVRVITDDEKAELTSCTVKEGRVTVECRLPAPAAVLPR